MQIEKALTNDRLRISGIPTIWLCSNSPVKFAIFLKGSLLFKFLLSFLFINKTSQLNNLKTWIAMNAKMSVFGICVEEIVYFSSYNMHDYTLNP